MARPEPKIIHRSEQLNGDEWQILPAERIYVITYQGRAIDIRVVNHGLGIMKFKYKRTSYTQLGTVIAQVRKYNSKFNTQDFDYITV